MKYRIYYSHCGDAPTHEDFTALSDKEAIEELERRRRIPEYGMDELYMDRVEVEEKLVRVLE